MDAGVSIKGLRVAGVPIWNDAWLTNFVAERVNAVILDVDKIDHVLSDGVIHYQMLRFCQNIHPGFLARNTTTPLISESLGGLNLVILESMSTKETVGSHTDWTSELRSFANMKLQLPHHRGGYGMTPCAGSTISASFMCQQLRLCGGWVITAMLSKISSTSRVFGHRERTCPTTESRFLKSAHIDSPQMRSCPPACRLLMHRMGSSCRASVQCCPFDHCGPC